MLAPATLARATLLGTFNFEEQAAGRVWTAWDRLVDIDLDHFNRAFGSAHDRRSWFSLMKRSSAQEWKTFRDADVPLECLYSNRNMVPLKTKWIDMED